MAPGVTLRAVPCWQVLASTVMRTPFWEANKQGLGEHPEISDTIAEILIVRRKMVSGFRVHDTTRSQKGDPPHCPQDTSCRPQGLLTHPQVCPH